jgi:RNA methyltransferase, TrmH family
MLSKAKIKYIESLHSKKFRQKYNNFIAEGEKIVNEIIQTKKFELELIVATSIWLSENKLFLRHIDCEIIECDESDLKKISTMTTPNKVFCVVKRNQTNTIFNEIGSDLSIYLDALQDPGNVGTILRIADWFGLPHVFCGSGTVDPFSPKVIQASMGAFLRVKIHEIELSEIKNQNPDCQIFGADMDGTSVFEMPKNSTGIIVIGNEGKGLQAESELLITKKISIPKHKNGGAESLNAGIATGIIVAALRN